MCSAKAQHLYYGLGERKLKRLFKHVVPSLSYPLLHLQVSALDKQWQPVYHQLAGFLCSCAVCVPLLALQHGGKQLGCILHVHCLDVAW